MKGRSGGGYITFFDPRLPGRCAGVSLDIMNYLFPEGDRLQSAFEVFKKKCRLYRAPSDNAVSENLKGQGVHQLDCSVLARMVRVKFVVTDVMYPLLSVAKLTEQGVGPQAHFVGVSRNAVDRASHDCRRQSNFRKVCRRSPMWPN